MIKVRHTEYLNNKFVAKCRLVLVKCDYKEATLFINSNKQLSAFNPAGPTTGIGLKPILISETEKIEVWDWFINGNVKQSNHIISRCENEKDSESLEAIKTYMNDPKFLKNDSKIPKQVITAKILALSEHISIDQLRQYNLKDGDEVYVECVWNKGFHSYSISLNLRNHVNIIPIEERVSKKQHKSIPEYNNTSTPFLSNRRKRRNRNFNFKNLG